MYKRRGSEKGVGNVKIENRFSQWAGFLVEGTGRSPRLGYRVKIHEGGSSDGMDWETGLAPGTGCKRKRR